MSIRYRSIVVPTALYASVILSSCATPATNPTGSAYVNNTSATAGRPVQTHNPYAQYPTTYPNTTYPNTQGYPSTQTYPTQQPSQVATTQQYFGSFAEWRDNYLRRAQSQGVAGANSIVGNAQLNSQVIRLDKNQAEFTDMPWQYLDKRLAGNTVATGIQKRRESLDFFNRIESRYGVPASIVTAIWGIESAYGANMGSTDLVDALSTLAYDGRRRAWAEGELTALVQLMERGDVSRNQTGSWGGGMGHTQFIPSTWSMQGVDADNDGRRNPWSRQDALASTANYLKNSGWVSGMPAYYEVKLPSNFDYRYIGTRQTLETWRNLGLNAVTGENFAGASVAELWLPGGINGPALLTTQNFEALKAYNNSSNYALSVAALAHRINSKQPFVASFPRHEQALSRLEVEQLQRTLTNRGYDTKGVDGVIGSNTRKAFARWQADAGKIPDAFISRSSVRGLI